MGLLYNRRMRGGPIMLLVVSGCGTLFGIDDVIEPPGNTVSGHITEDTRWQGAVEVVDITTIDPGVTITALPGTKIAVANTAHLVVGGGLDRQGLAGDVVTIEPAGGSFYGGIQVTGELTLRYAVQHGGAVITQPGSTTTLVDTIMYGASGDLLIMQGGNVDVSYSQLGAPAGITDSSHCNMHTGGPVGTIHVTHPVLSGAPFGVMFYAGTSADFTFDNWDNDLLDVDTEPGVAGDFSHGYFGGGGPVAVAGATLIANDLSPVPLAD